MTTNRPKKSDAFTKEEVEKILESLTPYEEEFEKMPERMEIKGKTFGQAQKDQAAWPHFYGGRRAELAILVKQLEAKVYAIRGRLHRFFKEHDSLGSSERQIEKYVDAHEDFLTANDVLLHVEELLKKYNEIMECFTKRGFALRDLTAARVDAFLEETL